MTEVIPIPILLAALVLLPGCDSQQTPEVDAAPFQAALEKHMKEQKWGVQVENFESIEVTGEQAEAQVRVSLEEATGLKPLWTVTYIRKDGTWQVEGVDRD